MAFKAYIVIMLVFVVGNFAFFFFSPLKYHLSLRTIRKALYTLFIGAIIVGLLVNEVKLSNWQFLLTLTAIVIFIDLALLLTPSIMKIWNTEFQYSDYVENIIMTNRKIQKGTMRRVGTMSEMIQDAGTYFSELQKEELRDKKKQLEKYLRMYAEKYGFLVQLWDLEYDPIEATHLSSKQKEGLEEAEINSLADNFGFLEGIKRVLSDIERLNSFEFGKEKEVYAESLFQSEIVSLISEDSMIVPIYLDDGNMIVILKNEKGELLEVDAIHITNLIVLFYTFDLDL
ncbi:type II toxin-antitoxin system SpoIISA family toxin [Bacillus solitudinis]|uniref:type II toxin-antitoxin system SpoIISA family toxin n=1 Tax=Bacillus solitudinis TaxID=2014074 RepID=UPI001D0D6068|nr:type II toxin-antitoxin system SpoIISA family toxin [Bacillus solitudinis]